MSNLKITKPCRLYFASIVGFQKEKLYQNTLDHSVIFFDSFTNCLNASVVEKPTWKTAFQCACCSPKRWLQYCTARHAKMSRYHIQFECQGEISQQQLNTGEKEKEEGREKAKGGVGGSPPCLSALQRIWTAEKRNRQQMPNQCSTCQTAPYPSQSAKKNYPLPDFSYLTNKGLVFSLIRTPRCKILALISAFNNMCCTSAQKESD